jgi:predicted phage tail protein
MSANPTISGAAAPGSATKGAFTVDVTGLSSNTIYHFRGYAANSTGLPPGYTADATFTTVSGAPTVETETALSASGFTANWGAPSGDGVIIGYRLDVATDSGFKSMASGYKNLLVSGTSRAVKGLGPGKQYYYRIRAVNAGGTSLSSTAMPVSTLAKESTDRR